MELKLPKETEFEGVKYATLDIDLDSLTGKDFINAESEAYALLGRPETNLDKVYHACVAARAAKVPAACSMSFRHEISRPLRARFRVFC